MERAGPRPASRRTQRTADRGLEGPGVASGRPGRLGVFRGRGRPGAEAAQGPDLGRRGHTPTVSVTATGTRRVSLAGLVGTRPGQRPHLQYRIHLYRGRTGE